MDHLRCVVERITYQNTGVTRAKKILVLIGEKKAIAYAVHNEKTTMRNTKLAERLQAGDETGRVAENVVSFHQYAVVREYQSHAEELHVAEKMPPYFNFNIAL